MLFFALLFCYGINLSNAQDSPLTQQGNFVIGCNYWASHAGTKMWADWKPDIVEKDFKLLSENGIAIIRVFPLWPDFQPIVQLYSSKGNAKEIAFVDGPLPTTGAGVYGVSEEQLKHFETVANLAKKYNLKIIVGLITGWMSGQLFVPPALEGRNILTDPTSLAWQQKFVKTFVSRFKNHTSIAAWDFGNECNEMATVQSYNEAYVWSALLSATIKSEDLTRPVLSGMHSLSPANNANWRIIDQAATTDLLTTHPYPFWTPYASQDPVNTIRTLMHSSAESRLYADIGGKPCIVEETGIMGSMRANETVKAAFARTILFSTWANDCHGLLWWCAFDQSNLKHTPYQWVAVERELGLIRNDGSSKPVLDELKKFGNFLNQLPFKTLPLRKREAVCILSEGQDNWAVAYSSYILAKQAGFDIEFQKAGQPLKDAPLYIVPSVKGVAGIDRDNWLELLDKVKQGASLYLSVQDGFVEPFVGPFGLDIVTNSSRIGTASFNSKNLNDSLKFKLDAPWKLIINPQQSKVLAKEDDGNPIFTETIYGKGKLYFLGIPLEMDLTLSTGCFDKSKPAYYKVYQHIAKSLIEERVLTQDNRFIALTEHTISNTEKVLVVVNYSPEAASSYFKLKEGWKISSSLYGGIPNKKIEIKANDALVLVVKK